MDDLIAWPGWGWAGWNAIAALGGLAGLLSLVVTLLRRRPRARWAFVRIEAKALQVNRMERIYLVFRNVGDAVAHDVHTFDTLNRAGRAVEQPMTGRLMLSPGEEIAVVAVAHVVADVEANRRHNAGDDSVFALSGELQIRWREPNSSRLRSWRMRPTRAVQGTVPITGYVRD
jgi:hypothetical protein